MGDALAIFAMAYACVSIFLIAASRSRGIVADILFGLLWPVYLYLDWKHGRL